MRQILVAFVGLALCTTALESASIKNKAKAAKPKKIVGTLKRVPQKARLLSPWRVPTFANSSAGDEDAREDAHVRKAASGALGSRNGAVIVSEAETGRLLTIVNQKLAFEAGYQPCSTVKVPVALAALKELIIDPTDPVRLGARLHLNMTQALAQSNNAYFAKLGGELGFQKVSSYAKMFGLGEKAGLGLQDERAAALPAAPPASGMGMMSSFGDGIRLTPLQLTALMGAVANGGTMYYLQYPSGAEFVPEVKRKLDISPLIDDIMPGLKGAVDFGTARRIGPNHEEPIYGKTGTCTDSRTPTHLGWFGSFSEVDGRKLVVTVLLTGGRGVSGPAAAGVAGEVYRRLAK